MCGIIGFLGAGDAVREVTGGLQTLEYRGYDSAGVAYVNGAQIKCVRAVGHVSALVKKVEGELADTTAVKLAIGHTRWATHGGVSEKNCHPHLSTDGTVAVVHNGIIENYKEQRQRLEDAGVWFKSDTDTEVIPNLIAQNIDGGCDLLTAVQGATKKLRGSYAFLAISTKHSETVVAAKNGSQPLVVGVGEDFMYLSSDIPTAGTRCGALYTLENGEFAIIGQNTVKFISSETEVTKSPLCIKVSARKPSKGKYSTFMEKEIREIPRVIRTIEMRYKKAIKNTDFRAMIDRIRGTNCVHIAACGTSYHAGLYIAQMLEQHCALRTKVYIASELQHISPFIAPHDIGIVISQSGETADTLLALQNFKRRGLFTVGICNVDGSSVSRYTDISLPTHAGIEIAVASTKAYIAQIAVGMVVVNALAGTDIYNLAVLAAAADAVFVDTAMIQKTARQHRDVKKIFILGKGSSAVTALEAALKVKEITYKHCEGLPAGELKHGTLSLVDDKTLAVIVTPSDSVAYVKMQNSAAEVRARGAKIWEIPQTPDGMISVVYAQLFAFYLASELGRDPDKPRNLAKSVTVD